MSRFRGGIVLACLVALPAVARADTFDDYINPILAKAVTSKVAERVKQLTPADLAQHSRAIPGLTAPLVVVKTNTRWSVPR